MSNASSPKTIPVGLRLIGFFKLATSCLLACITFGIFRLMGEHTGEQLEHFILHLHLDPERHWINQALVTIGGVNPKHLRAIGTGTLVYSALYAIEGIGLLKGKHWAEYMVVIITGSLLPLELYEIFEKDSVIRVSIFILNVAILVYLLLQLKRDYRRRL